MKKKKKMAVASRASREKQHGVQSQFILYRDYVIVIRFLSQFFPGLGTRVRFGCSMYGDCMTWAGTPIH